MEEGRRVFVPIGLAISAVFDRDAAPLWTHLRGARGPAGRRAGPAPLGLLALGREALELALLALPALAG
jgi:hypothetical protein